MLADVISALKQRESRELAKMLADCSCSVETKGNERACTDDCIVLLQR